MDLLARIDLALRRALADENAADGPPRLQAALRHAVFTGGARIRPRLPGSAQSLNGAPLRSAPGLRASTGT
jgi:geranylgeranyl diphosphate synthase type II